MLFVGLGANLKLLDLAVSSEMEVGAITVKLMVSLSSGANPGEQGMGAAPDESVKSTL